MEQTALTTLESFRLPALGGQAANYDPEEFVDIPMDFPQVKIPSGGQLSFELPNPLDPDDPTPCKTIEGVIVLQQTANAYWQDSDTTGAPPDCSSDDGATGYGTPGGQCAACPLNAFGSGEGGKGKACKNMKNLYILQDGSPMPLLLPLPPTSLKAFRQYANNLRFAGLGLSGVVTCIGLKRQESGGNTYSVATFRMSGRLGEALTETARAYARNMRESLEEMRRERAKQLGSGAVAPAMDPETGELRTDEPTPF